MTSSLVRPDSSSTTLYVATNLASFEAIERRPDTERGEEVRGGITYRRLDPAYYAWLRARMELAKRLRDDGRLATAAFEELRTRFNAMHAWAIEHFGQPALLRAVRETDASQYVPPSAAAAANGNAACVPPGVDDRGGVRGGGDSPTETDQWPRSPSASTSRYADHVFPRIGADALRCLQPVPAEALAKVDAIRDRALALGWPLAALYQNRGALRFPHGPDWGLVTMLDPGDVIGEVTAESIAIANRRGSVQRFYRPEGDAP